MVASVTTRPAKSLRSTLQRSSILLFLVFLSGCVPPSTLSAQYALASFFLTSIIAGVMFRTFNADSLVQKLWISSLYYLSLFFIFISPYVSFYLSELKRTPLALPHSALIGAIFCSASVYIFSYLNGYFFKAPFSLFYVAISFLYSFVLLFGFGIVLIANYSRFTKQKADVRSELVNYYESIRDDAAYKKFEIYIMQYKLYYVYLIFPPLLIGADYFGMFKFPSEIYGIYIFSITTFGIICLVYLFVDGQYEFPTKIRLSQNQIEWEDFRVAFRYAYQAREVIIMDRIHTSIVAIMSLTPAVLYLFPNSNWLAVWVLTVGVIIYFLLFCVTPFMISYYHHMDEIRDLMILSNPNISHDDIEVELASIKSDNPSFPIRMMGQFCMSSIFYGIFVSLLKSKIIL